MSAALIVVALIVAFIAVIVVVAAVVGNVASHAVAEWIAAWPDRCLRCASARQGNRPYEPHGPCLEGRFASTCAACGERVEAGAGVLQAGEPGRRWGVVHIGCEPTKAYR